MVEFEIGSVRFISCVATLYTVLLVRCSLSALHSHTFSQELWQNLRLRNDLPVTGLVFVPSGLTKLIKVKLVIIIPLCSSF